MDKLSTRQTPLVCCCFQPGIAENSVDVPLKAMQMPAGLDDGVAAQAAMTVIPVNQVDVD